MKPTSGSWLVNAKHTLR